VLARGGGVKLELANEIGKELQRLNENDVLVPSMESKTGWKYVSKKQMASIIHHKLL
jgi:hypothetical protein